LNYKIFCNESNHLLTDKSNLMVNGAIMIDEANKYINIKIQDIETKLENDNEFNLFVSDLEEKILYLARLAREAIIYLSFTIHQEELKKETLI